MGGDLAQSDPVLAEIVRRLVEAYQPERIYLFGSVARGDAGPNSDYDLLVVVPDDAPHSGGGADWPTKLCGAPESPLMCWSAPVLTSSGAAP